MIQEILNEGTVETPQERAIAIIKDNIQNMVQHLIIKEDHFKRF